MTRHRRSGALLLWLITGAVIGSLLGHLVALLLPAGVVRQFFLTGTSIGFGPTTVDLAVISFSLGLHLTINIVGVLGILLAAYYFRWYK
jgi:hypothetical protein